MQSKPLTFTLRIISILIAEVFFVTSIASAVSVQPQKTHLRNQMLSSNQTGTNRLYEGLTVLSSNQSVYVERLLDRLGVENLDALWNAQILQGFLSDDRKRITLEKLIRHEEDGGLSQEQNRLRGFIWETRRQFLNLTTITSDDLPKNRAKRYHYLIGLGNIIVQRPFGEGKSIHIGSYNLIINPRYQNSIAETEFTNGMPIMTVFRNAENEIIGGYRWLRTIGIDSVGNEHILNVHHGQIIRTSLVKACGDYEEVIVEVNAHLDDGAVKTAKGRPMLNGEFPKNRKRAWFYATQNQDEVFQMKAQKDAFFYQGISQESTASVDFKMVKDKRTGKYIASFPTGVSLDEINLLRKYHQIEGARTSKGGVFTLAVTSWATYQKFPEHEIRAVDIRHWKGRSYIVGTEILNADGEVLDHKTLSVIFEATKDAPDFDDKGNFISVCENVTSKKLTDPVNKKNITSYQIEDVPVQPGVNEDLRVGRIVGHGQSQTFHGFGGAHCDVRVIKGERKWVRLVADRDGRAIVGYDGKPVIIDVTRNISEQLHQKINPTPEQREAIVNGLIEKAQKLMRRNEWDKARVKLEHAQKWSHGKSMKTTEDLMAEAKNSRWKNVQKSKLLGPLQKVFNITTHQLISPKDSQEQGIINQEEKSGGETLDEKIRKRYGVSCARLCAKLGITDLTVLYDASVLVALYKDPQKRIAIHKLMRAPFNGGLSKEFNDLRALVWAYRRTFLTQNNKVINEIDLKTLNKAARYETVASQGHVIARGTLAKQSHFYFGPFKFNFNIQYERWPYELECINGVPIMIVIKDPQGAIVEMSEFFPIIGRDKSGNYSLIDVHRGAVRRERLLAYAQQWEGIIVINNSVLNDSRIYLSLKRSLSPGSEGKGKYTGLNLPGDHYDERIIIFMEGAVITGLRSQESDFSLDLSAAGILAKAEQQLKTGFPKRALNSFKTVSVLINNDVTNEYFQRMQKGVEQAKAAIEARKESPEQLIARAQEQLNPSVSTEGGQKKPLRRQPKRALRNFKKALTLLADDPSEGNEALVNQAQKGVQEAQAIIEKNKITPKELIEKAEKQLNPDPAFLDPYPRQPKRALRNFKKALALLAGDPFEGKEVLVSRAQKGVQEAGYQIRNKKRQKEIAQQPLSRRSLRSYYNEPVEMTDTERQKLFDRVCAGDNGAAEALLEGYMYLIADVAQGFHVWIYAEDLWQDGVVSLFESLRLYSSRHDKVKGFEAFSRKRLQEVFQGTRDEKGKKHQYQKLLYGTSLDTPIADGDFNLYDVIRNQEDWAIRPLFEKNLFEDALRKAIVWGKKGYGFRYDQLTPDERIIVWALETKALSIRELLEYVLWMPETVEPQAAANYIIDLYDQAQQRLDNDESEALQNPKVILSDIDDGSDGHNGNPKKAGDEDVEADLFGPNSTLASGELAQANALKAQAEACLARKQPQYNVAQRVLDEALRLFGQGDFTDTELKSQLEFLVQRAQKYKQEARLRHEKQFQARYDYMRFSLPGLLAKAQQLLSEGSFGEAREHFNYVLKRIQNGEVDEDGVIAQQAREGREQATASVKERERTYRKKWQKTHYVPKHKKVSPVGLLTEAQEQLNNNQVWAARQSFKYILNTINASPETDEIRAQAQEGLERAQFKISYCTPAGAKKHVFPVSMKMPVDELFARVKEQRTKGSLDKAQRNCEYVIARITMGDPAEEVTEEIAQKELSHIREDIKARKNPEQTRKPKAVKQPRPKKSLQSRGRPAKTFDAIEFLSIDQNGEIRFKKTVWFSNISAKYHNGKVKWNAEDIKIWGGKEFLVRCDIIDDDEAVLAEWYMRPELFSQARILDNKRNGGKKAQEIIEFTIAAYYTQAKNLFDNDKLSDAETAINRAYLMSEWIEEPSEKITGMFTEITALRDDIKSAITKSLYSQEVIKKLFDQGNELFDRRPGQQSKGRYEKAIRIFKELLEALNNGAEPDIPQRKENVERLLLLAQQKVKDLQRIPAHLSEEKPNKKQKPPSRERMPRRTYRHASSGSGGDLTGYFPGGGGFNMLSSNVQLKHPLMGDRQGLHRAAQQLKVLNEKRDIDLLGRIWHAQQKFLQQIVHKRAGYPPSGLAHYWREIKENITVFTLPGLMTAYNKVKRHITSSEERRAARDVLSFAVAAFGEDRKTAARLAQEGHDILLFSGEDLAGEGMRHFGGIAARFGDDQSALIIARDNEHRTRLIRSLQQYAPELKKDKAVIMTLEEMQWGETDFHAIMMQYGQGITDQEYGEFRMRCMTASRLAELCKDSEAVMMH